MEDTQTGPPLGGTDPVIDDHVDDNVLQISGAGHWFLEGGIGDHSVEFLVHSGSSVTAMSDSLYQILVCDLAVGTDAIIGTDVLGSVLPHTLDIKNGFLFTEGGALLQLLRSSDALSGRVFTVGHCSVPPYSEAVLHCTVRTAGGRIKPSSGLLEGLTVFLQKTLVSSSAEPW